MKNYALLILFGSFVFLSCSTTEPTQKNNEANFRKSAGNQFNIFDYIEYVMNPTLDEVGNRIQLENDELIIVKKPDMVYTMTNKVTGLVTEGRYGFNMDIRNMNEAKDYFLEIDISKMTRKQFLEESNYEKNAQIVLTPIACNAQSVTYKYIRPEELKDKEISFSIKLIKK
jgi:hypothetical protein